MRATREGDPWARAEVEDGRQWSHWQGHSQTPLSKESQAALVMETRDSHSTAVAGQVHGDKTGPWSKQEDKSAKDQRWETELNANTNPTTASLLDQLLIASFRTALSIDLALFRELHWRLPPHHTWGVPEQPDPGGAGRVAHLLHSHWMGSCGHDHCVCKYRWGVEELHPLLVTTE